MCISQKPKPDFIWSLKFGPLREEQSSDTTRNFNLISQRPQQPLRRSIERKRIELGAVNLSVIFIQAWCVLREREEIVLRN